MKLKDIFSQNTNKVGWLKTFKKLGADNEVLKKLSKEIDNAENNAGGSEVVETPRSYYKIRQEFLEENNATVGQTVSMVTQMVHSLDLGYLILTHKNEYNFEIDISWSYVNLEFTANQFIGYFSILNAKNHPSIIYKDYDFESNGVVNGIGLQERYYCIIKEENPDISYEDFTEMWNEEIGKMFEEITKEEYESQLTIK